MEKTNNQSNNPPRCSYTLIARKLNCSPKYVSLVLRGKLGKYGRRDTELVKKIREMAARIEEMFKPE